MDEKIEKLARALYDELEDQNYHSVCALINWVFDLYPTRYYGDCISSSAMVEKLPVRDIKIRFDESLEFKIRKFKMVLTFKEVRK